MDNLLTRLRRTGALFLVGFLLLVGIILGFLYFQQGQQQKGLEEQIVNVSLVISKPLPGVEKLKAEYDEVNRALSPISVEAALDIIVGIASESGIDVDPDSGKLHIPPPAVRDEKMGNVSYQVLSFGNIKVQGDYDSVMAFISDLDSGKTLETMVLKRASLSQTTVKGEDEGEIKIETIATLDVDLYTKPGE